VRTRFLLIAAVVTILGAACTSGSGNPKHASSTPSVSTASPTPTRTGPLTTGLGVRPGEKPPTLPQAAKQHTSAGALRFAEYFVHALDWSFATNDAYLLHQVSSSSCHACARYISSLESLEPTGKKLLGSRITIESERVTSGDFKVRSDFVVEFVLNDQAAVLVDQSGVRSTVAPGIKHDTSLVFVTWQNAKWTVTEEGAPS
jgi:hypothetical protein